MSNGVTSNQGTTDAPAPGDVPTSGATDSGGLTSSAQGSDSMTGAVPTTGGETETSGTTNPSLEDSAGSGASATSGASETNGGPGTGGPGPDTGGPRPDMGAPECVPIACEYDGQVYACGDCSDNDGDGASDCADPECFGPCDDAEDVFGTPLVGKDPCKQDCYFDGDGGQGGSDCQWNLKCDPLEPGGWKCPYNPNLDPDDPDDLTDNYGKCVDGDPAACAGSCAPPNGCDCFGCCTIEGVDRFIGSPGCSADDLAACNLCTKQDALCGNPCEEGEVCFPDLEVGLCE